MASTYWIEESLAGILPTLWMFLGVGLPWAFASLSRSNWHSKALVAALALALGPAWTTAWMLALGVVGAQLGQSLLKPEWILLGGAVIAAVGCAIAWRKRHVPMPARAPGAPFEFDEKLIVALIAIAVALRWIHTAFWPFTAYDALWVFGYQGRLFFLEGTIPNAIDYYPPFLSLQFAYVQTLLGGINDHAARMVLPMLHIGSVLAAYLLGARLANRRAGLFTAALWSLHPYVSQWAVIGDLEIPLTFGFTLASVFFLRAWAGELEPRERRREALLAGVMLGIALFTKPTAGAFIWGVLLLLAVDLIQKRGRFRPWLPRFRVALWTGLTCIPLGGIWYLRNLALGHDAVTLPKALWLTRALRNGDILAPLALAAIVAWLALALRLKLKRGDVALGATGILLLLAGLSASNPRLFPERVDPPASAITTAETILIAVGLALSGYSLRAQKRMAPMQPSFRRMLGVGAWALLLALPYFVTLFYAYSYHYRLGFAVWPLLLLPTAFALSMLLAPERIRRWSAMTRRGYHLALCCLSLPGILAVATDVTWSSIWMMDDKLDSDVRKYQVFNPSLLEAVFGLEDFARETGTSPIVLAPGEERLPFFFPQMQIIDLPLTTLDEYEVSGATHFIYGAKAREAYLDAGIRPTETQLVSALGRKDLFERARAHFDGTFSYELYESNEPGRRYSLPPHHQSEKRNEFNIVFDEVIRVYNYGGYPPVLLTNTPITFDFTWRALAPLERDFEFALRMQDMDTKQVVQEWDLQTAGHRHGDYSTIHWELDEFISDRQVLRLDANVPPGDRYIFSLGVWDPLAERFLPLAIDWRAAGDFFVLASVHEVRN